MKTRNKREKTREGFAQNKNQFGREWAKVNFGDWQRIGKMAKAIFDMMTSFLVVVITVNISTN